MRAYLYVFVACVTLNACTPEVANTNTNKIEKTPADTFAATAKTQVTFPEPLKLATQKACVACHHISLQTAGPAWQKVSAFYQNPAHKISAEQLAQKILNGGSGQFGKIVMPPQTGKLSVEEAVYLADWILKLSPQE